MSGRRDANVAITSPEQMHVRPSFRFTLYRLGMYERTRFRQGRTSLVRCEGSAADRHPDFFFHERRHGFLQKLRQASANDNVVLRMLTLPTLFFFRKVHNSSLAHHGFCECVPWDKLNRNKKLDDGLDRLVAETQCR